LKNSCHRTMFDGKGSGRELFAAGLLTFGGWRSGGTGRGHLRLLWVWIGALVSFPFFLKPGKNRKDCSDRTFD
jgi:hypothetical protein